MKIGPLWFRRWLHRMQDKRRMVIVTLRLTAPQRIAFEDMMATWNMLSGQGGSRWTKFYADGDGDFHPRVRLNGKRPQFTTLISKDRKWPSDEYEIDFDWIAWALHRQDSHA